MEFGKQEFKTEISVCSHRVIIRYWDFDSIVTPSMEKFLTEEGENMAMDRIIDGYTAGDLCAYWLADCQEEEIHGWWEIIKE